MILSVHASIETIFRNVHAALSKRDSLAKIFYWLVKLNLLALILALAHLSKSSGNPRQRHPENTNLLIICLSTVRVKTEALMPTINPKNTV